MKLDKLVLKNFRGIKSLELPLDESLTLIAGSNGAGKSAILDAITILLSWLTARARNLKGGSGRPIPESQIKNGESFAKIAAISTDNVQWQLVKARAGHEVSEHSDLSRIKSFTSEWHDIITQTHEEGSIPLFAYYPINRAVIDIPLRISGTYIGFKLLEAWEESLTNAANFRSFFSWFRQREDLENENRIYLYSANKPEDWEFPDRQLECVRQALTGFLPEFQNFKVRRRPLRMTVFKEGEELSIEQLSHGEKCLIALIGDIARRLAIANPTKSNPLAGEGIILIDEFDLHLHPQWQRRVIRLPLIFKNCQFIVTTHSPQVLGEVKAEQLRILQRDQDNQINFIQPSQSYGLTSNEILDEIMLINERDKQFSRTPRVADELDTIFELIDDELLDEAQRRIAELEKALNGEIPELLRAKMRIELQDWGD